MKLQKKDIMRLLDSELIWCKEHKQEVDENGGVEFKRGFIKGLQQAKLLIKQLASSEWIMSN